MELKEYAYAEVDVDFVRKCVRAIGRCALKIESSAERCVAVLVDLIQVDAALALPHARFVSPLALHPLPSLCLSLLPVSCLALFVRCLRRRMALGIIKAWGFGGVNRRKWRTLCKRRLL